MKKITKKIIYFSILILLSACSGIQRESNQLANQLSRQSPQIVLTELQKIDPPERDYAQFHLNVGYLQLLSGDFASSIETLTLAKKEMASLEAISVSENVGAGTVNETLRSYSGYPTDRVMIHNMLALSYLFNNDIESARVEMLQADISMKKLASRNSLHGQLVSTHVLSGIIYELLNEQSNSLISYKFAEELLNERGLTIPLALKKSLLRMSYAIDRNGQYNDYKKRYSGFPIPSLNSKSQVFTLHFDGVVSNKKENTIMIPSGNREQLIRISMPAYPNASYRGTRAKLSDASQQIVTELIENLEVSVREDLQKEYPSILLLTTTRALAKYELVDQAVEKDSLLGALVNIATVLSEVADLRSWNMLPSNIQFAYMETSERNVLVDSAKMGQQQIQIQPKSKNLLLISSLEMPVFHYQQ